jgi:hypothetical protein
MGRGEKCRPVEGKKLVAASCCSARQGMGWVGCPVVGWSTLEMPLPLPLPLLPGASQVPMLAARCKARRLWAWDCQQGPSLRNTPGTTMAHLSFILHIDEYRQLATWLQQAVDRQATRRGIATICSQDTVVRRLLNWLIASRRIWTSAVPSNEYRYGVQF